MKDEQLGSRKGALAWMADNNVAANLLMAMLIVGGLVMMPRVKQEVFPEFEVQLIGINLTYPGASPEEVEQGAVLAVEEAVRGLNGVKSVTSDAGEGWAYIAVELMLDEDVDSAVADVKSSIDRITSFPADLEEPKVQVVARQDIPVALAVAGRVDELTLRDLADEAREQLLNDPRLTKVEMRERAAREIAIEVPMANLRRYGLTIAQIAQAVRAASIDLPGGAVKTRGGEILVRTAERRDLAEEFEEIAIATRPDGAVVRVRDVGQVREGFDEDAAVMRFNGKPAAILDLHRSGSETPLDVAQALEDYIAEASPGLPPGVSLHTWGRWAENYEGRIDLLLSNAYMGLALVMLVLGSFLNVRLAFWVTMGIPISFIGSILIFPAFDVSFNMVSLFAFIIALGMVVDDAIVVGESIYHERQQGKGALHGAIVGVRRVGVPVVFSVTTTIVTFLPLLFIPGASGKFMRNIPLVVIAVLTISLVESLFILPAHLAHTKLKHDDPGLLGVLERAQGRVSRGLERFIERTYRPVLTFTLRRRYLTLSIAIAGLVATLGLIEGGRLKFTFLPRIERDSVKLDIEVAPGTPRAAMIDLAERVVAASDRVVAENGGEDKLRTGMLTAVTPGNSMVSAELEMPAVGVRALSSDALAELWRRELGDLPGTESVRFNAGGGPSPAGLDVELSHADMEVLRKAAARLARRMETYAGVASASDGFNQGKQQLDLTLEPAARSLGITATDLGLQLRGAFYGAEALRQQRGRDEVRVYVRRPPRERASQYDLERFLIRTDDGGEIPLGIAADIDKGRSFTKITRRDGRRMVHVTAEIDEGAANQNEIMQSLEADDLPQLLADFPGLSYERAGASRGQDETLDSLGPNYTLALLGIYMILAVVFRSYLQPLVVMVAIPFGFIGAIWGHFAMGYDLSLISLMGITALSGVVVNDSLVLIVSVNENREEGMGLWDALVAGGTRRFRPILLTSLTTFFGLMPMLTETSRQARFLIPMAISLAFGILFATVLILLAVPATYLIMEDARAAVRRAFRWVAHGETGPLREPAE